MKKRINRRQFLKATGLMGLGVASASLLQSCAPATPTPEPTRKDIVLGVRSEAKALGFTIKPGGDGSKVRRQILPKMLQVNYETGVLEPELAVEWAAETPTTWVVKLREGVQWTGGYGEVTAEDVAYTINYMKENQTYKHNSAHAFTINADVRDTHVVAINLSAPFGAFPGICLDDGGIVACKAAHEEMGDEEYNRMPVGWGPYILEEWVSGSHYTLKKNPDYWREGQPSLEEVVVRIIPDPAIAFASLEKGEIDWTDNLMASDFASIEANADLTLNSDLGWNWNGIGFGFAPYFDPEFVTEDYPTQIKEVRQAISYAINRQDLVDAVYAGHARAGDNPLIPGFMGFSDLIMKYPAEGDLAKAQELMDAAGVDGFELPIIVDSGYESMVREMEIIAENLSKINIDVKIEVMDSSTWKDLWRNNQFTAGYREIGFIAADSDAPIFAINRSGLAHWKGWDNGPVDGWLDQTRAESDSDVRAELFGKVVERIVDECPYVYTVHLNIVRAHNAKLTGIPMSRVFFHVDLRTAQWTA